jgi:hypothetical protein
MLTKDRTNVVETCDSELRVAKLEDRDVRVILPVNILGDGFTHLGRKGAMKPEKAVGRVLERTLVSEIRVHPSDKGLDGVLWRFQLGWWYRSC